MEKWGERLRGKALPREMREVGATTGCKELGAGLNLGRQLIENNGIPKTAFWPPIYYEYSLNSASIIGLIQ